MSFNVSRETCRDILDAFGVKSLAHKTMSVEELQQRFGDLQERADGRDPRLMLVHTMLYIERSQDPELYKEISGRLGGLQLFERTS